MSGSQRVLVQAKGLSTLNNPLSSAVVDGSMAEALNVVIDRNDVVEPRRGFAQYGNTFGDGTSRAKQLFNYKDVIIRHAQSTLQYDSDSAGTFVTFSGPSIDQITPGLRIKGVEANGNFYFVTETGVKKISAKTAADFATNGITQAGGVKALDITGTPNYSTGGFLTPYSKVAYRIVWGYNDTNDNLILGSPSSRDVIFNSTASSCYVDLSFSVPEDVDSTDYFYQVYRTGVFAGDVSTEAADPGDEMNLVFEDNVTSGQLSSGLVQVADVTPETFRKNGTLLYTNPNSGDGIASANEKPPFATDICAYKGYVFYANTKTVQSLNLSFLSVQAMVSNASTITIQTALNSSTYTFQGSVETTTANFTGSVSTDFANASSGSAKYFTVTSANNERTYYVWFYQSVNDIEPVVSGAIGIKVVTLNTDTVTQIMDKTITAMNDVGDFNVNRSGTVMTIICANNGYVTVTPTKNIASPFLISKNGLGTGEDATSNKIFLPRVPTTGENGPTTSQQLEQVATSFVRVLTKKDSIVYPYYISGFNDIPGQVLLQQQNTTGAAFWVTSNVGQEFTPTLPSSGATVISTNEIRPNRIFYSKFQQPDAVPLANYMDVGPQDREIKRILALRDSLFILKEDGIYRLSGDTDPFTITPFDFSAQVLAPDTAVVLNNQIYALSTQGVIVITDTGVSVISRPIENQLLQITKNGFNYKTASFGVSYETDRAYLLWTVTEQSDTVATQCFRYNTFTQSWTRWDNSKSCGIVNFADDKLYLGAGDTNFVERERKSLTRSDYADREYTLQIPLNGVNGTTVTLSSISNVEIGDALIQKQYLVPSQFNRTLEKLDLDSKVTGSDYFSTLAVKPGGSLRANLGLLTAKLDADPGVSDSTFTQATDSYTYSISGIAGSVVTIGTHHILPTRYVTMAGLTYQVLSVTSTTITVDSSVTGSPSSLQTADNDSRDLQACYNIIAGKLNTDGVVYYHNYPTSTSYIEQEAVVLSVDTHLNTVTVELPMEFLDGDVTLYKAIASLVIWNPQFFGDPSVEKQVREGTVMFENSNFSLVTIGYSTDRAPSFVDTTFNGAGIGDWGEFGWGGVNFGGVAAPTPLRTYIPLDKQRCRMINVKFQHQVALEKFSVYGISLTYRAYNIRTTK